MRALTIAAIIVALLGAAYWAGGREDRLRDRAETAEKEKEIGDAINNADDASWRDWLLGRD
ncbi:hypothetical protein [Sulfitobacter sp.]|uniref:hypothetical protein n=1 Tax=Sulfitobacter sp. TaxID=1903071 RepID=UPI003F6BD095